MLKRDSKGRFIKSTKKEVQKELETVSESVNVSECVPSGNTSKNHVKQPLFVKPVLCHTCGFDYLKKRIPILQKRDEEGDKTGIYVCKKCAEVQRG